MKNKYILLVCLFLGLISFASAQQPLTITRVNFGYTLGPDTVSSVNGESVKIPAEGTNKIWDYSGLIPISTTFVNFEAKTNPAFPDALFYGTDLFDVFAVGRGYYYDEALNVTDAGYYGLGINIAAQPYGIGDLTMNPLDSLTFLATNNLYANPRYVVRFPLTYGTVTTNNYTIDAPFQLSISAYSLSKAPGIKRRIISATDSVLGWGTLLLPGNNGNPKSMEALLVKRYISEVDSFFLYGQPAPAALLAAFQMTQGASMSTGKYLFYRAYARSYALLLNFDNQRFAGVSTAYYDNSIVGTMTGVVEPVANDARADVWPNPSRNGVFTIAAAQPVSSIAVRNILGMEVLRQDARQGALTVSLPPSSLPGMYFYQLKDARGGVAQTGKLLFTK
jgi:hypothetical protein